MISLNENTPFPDVTLADEDGLLAVGGRLTTKRLLEAYNSGIFPWYSEGQPLLWWSPDPRMVLFLNQFKVSKSLRKAITSGEFKVTINTTFAKVVQECALAKRNDQEGTWITQEMVDAYVELHNEGHAVSVEVWQNAKLVGGLYGIDLPEKGIFCGESMFYKVSDASKVAFYHLVEHLKARNYKLIDCQVYTKHLASLGACLIPRDEFVKHLT